MADDPRSWTPPEGSQPWERAGARSKLNRRTAQLGALIRWGWIALFVLVGIAIVLGRY
jgi:hypothetical protein